MQFKQITLSIIAASALIFGPAAMEATTSIDLGTSAFAKGGNGGGNGGGSNSSSGRSSSSEGSSGRGSSKDHGNGSAVSGSDSKGGNAYGQSKERSLGNDRGALASKLGALNAAHASANARLNASENSRVGMIALYEKSVLAGVEISADYEETGSALQSLLEDRAATLPEDYDSIEAVDAEIVSLRSTLDSLQATADALDGGLLDDAQISALLSEYEISLQQEDGADKSLDQLTDDLEIALQTELDTTESKIGSLTAVADQYNGYEAQISELETELVKLEGLNDAQAQTEVDALSAAANKTLSSEVVDEVNRLLGIESAYAEPVSEIVDTTADAG